MMKRVGVLGSPARRRAGAMAAAMAAAAVLAAVGKPRRRLADERPPVRLEDLFAQQLGNWRAAPTAPALVRPAAEAGKLYGIYDQVLERIYLGPGGERVMLSVAYGTEQSVGLQVHRPEVCYPGGGFKVGALQRTRVALGGRSLPVTRLVATQPGRSEPITYWTVLGGVVEGDAAGFRWRQLSFGLRGQILDGMLVRVSTIDAATERAWSEHTHFIRALEQALPAAALLQIMGATLPPLA